MSLVGLGSVSDAIMRNCHSPVLLVRNKADKMSHPVGAQAVSWCVCVCVCVCVYGRVSNQSTKRATVRNLLLLSNTPPIPVRTFVLQSGFFN